MLLKKPFWPSDTHQNDKIALYFTQTQTEQKCEILDLTTKLFQFPTGLSWWYREKHCIDTNARSFSCNKTSEQWCEELALLVNIEHWDYILSAEDDTQEMEPKHCKNFTQFQVKLEGQWLTSVWKTKQHLEFCSGDDLSENSRLLREEKSLLSLEHPKFWSHTDYKENFVLLCLSNTLLATSGTTCRNVGFSWGSDSLCLIPREIKPQRILQEVISKYYFISNYQF